MSKLKQFINPIIFLMAFIVGLVVTPRLIELYRSGVRNAVTSRVFQIRGVKDGSGGTGFQIEAPSGEHYIVTNAHICEAALKEAKSESFLIVQKDDHSIKRQVIEISEEADLCLVEGWPNMTGLPLGDIPEVGDLVSAVGHPLLGPVTMTTGEVTEYKDVSIPLFIMPELVSTENKCDRLKNELKEVNASGLLGNRTIKICFVKETNALISSVNIFPGSSGSPLVNKWGQVIGVMFASDRRSNWGVAVNLNTLTHFLKYY
jgi:S1-C subfamily serine protease